MTREWLDLTLQQFHLATESNLIKLSIIILVHVYVYVVLVYLPRWSYMFYRLHTGYCQVIDTGYTGYYQVIDEVKL